MREIERDIVSAVLTSADGKILLVQKPHTKSIYAGKWCIPGGGVEKGETYHDALVREILEETGIAIAGLPQTLVDTSGDVQEKYLRDTGETVRAHMRFFTYALLLPTPAQHTTVTIDDEHIAYAWVAPSDLHAYDMPEPSVRLFSRWDF